MEKEKETKEIKEKILLILMFFGIEVSMIYLLGHLLNVGFGISFFESYAVSLIMAIIITMFWIIVLIKRSKKKNGRRKTK